ncbi:MAG: acyltransferase family protein [Bacteroidales bacterium]|nr:acyltransferase family protein [Bacteroidales bacterium]
MGKARIAYWDNLKGILIALVVLGHTGTAMGDRWLSVIYAFHMPLFVFVSGFFSRKRDNFWESTRKLIILYLLFNTIYLLLDIIPALTGGGNILTFKRLLTPSFALWYILSLIFWRILVQLLPERAFNRSSIVIVISILLSLIVGFVPIGTPLTFQRTFVFLPFFMTGYLARKTDLTGWLSKHRSYYAIVAFLLLAVICYLTLPVFYGSAPYESAHAIRGLFIRFIQLIIAAAMGMSLMLFAPDKKSILTELGEITLLVYLLHPPFIKLFKLALSRVGIPMNPVTAVIISALTIFILYSVRNLRILKPLR